MVFRSLWEKIITVSSAYLIISHVNSIERRPMSAEEVVCASFLSHWSRIDFNSSKFPWSPWIFWCRSFIPFIEQSFWRVGGPGLISTVPLRIRRSCCNWWWIFVDAEVFLVLSCWSAIIESSRVRSVTILDSRVGSQRWGSCWNSLLTMLLSQPQSQ